MLFVARNTNLQFKTSFSLIAGFFVPRTTGRIQMEMMTKLKTLPFILIRTRAVNIHRTLHSNTNYVEEVNYGCIL